MSQVPPSLPPSPLQYATPPSGQGPNIRAIALNQRAIMLCILGEIACVIVRLALPPNIGIIFAFVYLAISITASVFVFKLALCLYSTGTGIVLGILTLIPCLGLLVLLVINSKATTVLRSFQIKVGLLGADPKQLPDQGQTLR